MLNAVLLVFCALSGAVGKPFPYVEVLIAKPNVYAGNGYDLIAQGDWKKTKVIPGTF